MTAYFLYLVALLWVSCNARPQQSSHINIPLVSEIDFHDYQLYQPSFRLNKPLLLRRPAKPRSPIYSSSVAAQNKVTPVPILKQINRHNEDGSYTYGFEGADGSFKIETKLASGEVIGKYGYVDDSGKTRIVEYGANKYGFQPAGEGITVPPATLANDTEADKPADDYEGSREETTTTRIKMHRRKPVRPSQAMLLQQKQRPKSQPSAYLVQEIDENSLPSQTEINQRQLVTASDINSLQYLLADDFQEALTAQNPSHEFAQRKSNSPVKLEEDTQSTNNRAVVHSFPIPAIFENGAPNAAMNKENAQFRWALQHEIADGGLKSAVSRSHTRNKAHTQYLLISPVDNTQLAQSAQSPATVKRHSTKHRSILDELLKQYAIPNNMSTSINDFSFGNME